MPDHGNPITRPDIVPSFSKVPITFMPNPPSSSRPSPSRLRRWVSRLARWTAGLLAVALIFGVLWFRHAFRDRYPGYSVELRIDDTRSRSEPKPLRAGFAHEKINPTLGIEGRPVWMAGFSNGRAATAIHDDLLAAATVIDDGHTRVGMVVLDAIGLFHDDVIAIRAAIPASAKLDYTIVCSTHNHSTPDLMGLWGPTPFQSGIDPHYRDHVIQGAVKALTNAVASLQPARLELHHIPTPPDGLVADTRKPDVYDSDLRVMLFRAAEGPSILGSIVNWGNHPETPWSKNTEITADFPGILRQALEEGIRYDGVTKVPGMGGTHVFVNGCVGGLMTTHPSVTVRDPFLQKDFKEPTHEKTRALGHQLARRILDRIAVSNAPATATAPLSIRARTIEIPLANRNFLLATGLGILNRGHVRWNHFRTEIAVLTLGDASMTCIPGEIYPELVNGGVEQPPGADFGIPPQEVPPIRQWLPGKIQFVFGLANDEIGYIIPKSEWDTEPPYLYGKSSSVYGEVNSVGPETAGILHRELKRLVEGK